MKPGFIARIVSAAAAASVALAPFAAQAGEFETQFDRLLGTATRAPRGGELKTPPPRIADQKAGDLKPAPRLSAPTPRLGEAKPPIGKPATAPASRSASADSTRFADLPRPSSPARSDALEVQLASLAEASQGRIGVAALDLATGRTVAVRGEQPFPMASTSKIAIVATFLAGVDQGKWSLTDRFPLMIPVPSRKFDGAVAPVRQGAMVSALQLIELAITRSDNHATDALLAVVGGPAVVTRWVHNTTGITEFHLDRDIATLVRDDGAVNPAVTIDRRDSITPAAMVRLLAGLNRNDWLSDSSRNVLLGAMGRCLTGRNRMRAMLPQGTAIAHKTGTLFNTASDVGFIETPDGRKLAVAIYVTGQGGKPGRESRIALLARTIYDGYTAERPLRTVLRR